MEEGHSFNHTANDNDWEIYWARNGITGSREWYLKFANREENINCKCLQCQFINLRWIILGIKKGHMK